MKERWGSTWSHHVQLPVGGREMQGSACAVVLSHEVRVRGHDQRQLPGVGQAHGRVECERRKPRLRGITPRAGHVARHVVASDVRCRLQCSEGIEQVRIPGQALPRTLADGLCRLTICGRLLCMHAQHLRFPDTIDASVVPGVHVRHPLSSRQACFQRLQRLARDLDSAVTHRSALSIRAELCCAAITWRRRLGSGPSVASAERSRGQPLDATL